ncbi:MAG TPA: hypothetical protein ENJ73_03625 [Desulfobacterales bacterium]|nr:hypothetical protein [Desulfobacterales bacterium]
MSAAGNAKKAKKEKRAKRCCPGCHGSGQVSFFQGVSRFLLTWEECPECAGLGYLLAEEGPGAHSPGAADRSPPSQEEEKL